MSGRIKLNLALVSCTAALAIVAATGTARAADLPAPVAPVTPVASFSLFEGIEVHGQVDAGALFNSHNPSQGPNGEGYNFGHLYTDHAGVPELNQALLTITKPIDPKATGLALGFTLQGLYGSDMRTNHFLGIGTFFMGRERAQLNVIQAFGAVHFLAPIGTGTDVKVGLFTSPQGYETLDPSTSPFYSHSYTYNYSVTFNHTGILTTTHLTPIVDLWLGVDTGNQTTFGRGGDPNSAPAGFVGFGLNNLLNDKLTVLALSHIGPEQADGHEFMGTFNVVDPHANRDLRYYNDVVFTYKINDAWTSVTELNYFHDDFGFGPTLGGAADSYSAVQYFSYAFAHDYTLNVRGEVYRDRKNFTVSTPTDNSGLAKTELGFPAAALTSATLGGPAGGPGTTYASGTIGITFKPDVPKPFALLAIRPEVRYDKIVSGNALYGGDAGPASTSRSQFTFGGDIILGF